MTLSLASNAISYENWAQRNAFLPDLNDLNEASPKRTDKRKRDRRAFNFVVGDIK